MVASPDVNQELVIVDYGMGNIQSVQNALERLGGRVSCSSDPQRLERADAIVLPGVGAFGEAVANLKQTGMDQAVVHAAREQKKPVLAICLGMQLLADESEERGRHRGLGLIPGAVRRIPAPPSLRLPHMGWNVLRMSAREPIFGNIQDGDCVYFVHSFRFETDARYVSAVTDYGGDVVAAVQSGHIFGMQFHPERSQTTGLKIMKNFLDYVEKLCAREGGC